MTGMPKIFKKVVKLCSVVIAFILTIELCARIDDTIRFSAPFLQKYTADRLRTIDNEGLQINMPNARFEKWRNNSFGFRGPEISQRKLPGMLRIVCLGASESYGYYESPDKEWPAQLTATLPYPKYQVINASVAGMALGSCKAYLKKYVLPIEPDIIIFFVNPFFYASCFDSAKKNDASQAKSVRRTEKKPTLRLKVAIISNIRFLPKMKQVAKNAVQNSFPELLRRYQLMTTQKQIEVAESERLGGRMPKDAVPDACIKDYKDDLSGLVDFIESRGVKVILCTYPSLISRENLASTYYVLFLSARVFSIEYSLRGIVDVQNKLNKVTRTVAVEKGTLLVDCQELMPKSIEYFVDNVHYTDDGARLIADGIAARIRNQFVEPVLPAVKNVEKKRHDFGG